MPVASVDDSRRNTIIGLASQFQHHSPLKYGAGNVKSGFRMGSAEVSAFRAAWPPRTWETVQVWRRLGRLANRTSERSAGGMPRSNVTIEFGCFGNRKRVGCAEPRPNKGKTVRRSKGQSQGSKASSSIIWSASFCGLVAEKLIRSTPSATAPGFASPIGKAPIQPSFSQLCLDQR